MTPAELRAALTAIDWSGADLTRALAESSGRKLRRNTISDYLTGKARVPAGVAFAVALLLAAKDADFAIPPPTFTDGRHLRWSKKPDAKRTG